MTDEQIESLLRSMGSIGIDRQCVTVAWSLSLLASLNFSSTLREEYSDIGLCEYLRVELAKHSPGSIYSATLLLKEMFVLWPEFSGNRLFPIRSPDPNRSPANAYEAALAVRQMWNLDTPYGAARLRLLAWTVDLLHEVCNYLQRRLNQEVAS